VSRRQAAALVAALLAFGIASRIALQSPLHRFGNEADSLLVGFGAWEILSGDPRIFVSTGYRQGSADSYLVAAVSWLVGGGRAAIALEATLIGILQIFVWWQALLELGGFKACGAVSTLLLAFIVLPSPAMVYWGIYWPTSYPTQMLASMVVLWTAARYWRRGRRSELLMFAFACGLAFWMSMLTLSVSVPTALWLAWHRRRIVPGLWDILLAVVCGLAGALPWLAFNLRYGWVSLKANWAVGTVQGWSGLADHARRLASEVAPGLVLAGKPFARLDARSPATVLALVAVVTLSIAVPVLLATAVSRRRSPVRAVEGHAPLAPLALASGIVATACLLFVGSAAASGPGDIVRYILPAYLVLPLLFALAWEDSSRAIRALLATAASSLFVVYAAAFPWPWTHERETQRLDLFAEREMVARLEQSGVEAIFGSFWSAYPLIYESGGRLGGGTLEPDYDFHRFQERLPRRPCRWALVSHSGALAARAGAAGIRGELQRFKDGSRLFVAAPADAGSSPGSLTCAESLELLRRLAS
jgi:hypothetical protein